MQAYEGDTVELTQAGKNLLKRCGYGEVTDYGKVTNVGRFYDKIDFPGVGKDLLFRHDEYKVVRLNA